MTDSLKIVKDEESGEYLLQLTDEVCEELGWEIGDSLKWEDQGDGSWSLRKVDNVLDKEKEDHS